MTNRNDSASDSLFEVLPRWVLVPLGMIVCAIVAYYIGEFVIVMFGHTTKLLQSPFHLGIIAAYLCVCSFIGLAVRHIVAVGIIVGTGVGLFHLRSALNGTGEWMPWVRDIFVNVFWPVFNGFLFAGYMKLLKGQEDVVGTA